MCSGKCQRTGIQVRSNITCQECQAACIKDQQCTTTVNKTSSAVDNAPAPALPCPRMSSGLLASASSLVPGTWPVALVGLSDEVAELLLADFNYLEQVGWGRWAGAGC